MVADEGFDVIEARTADEAYRFLQDHPSLQLVITDIQTGGAMNGCDLAWEVTRRWPHICVVWLAGLSVLETAICRHPRSSWPSRYRRRSCTRRSRSTAASAMYANASHHEVFRRVGACAGWPANYGLWAWGDELLTVFAVGRVGPKGDIHELDREDPFKPCQVRSLDGGTTWTPEPFHGHVPGGASLSADKQLHGYLSISMEKDIT